MRSRLIPRPRAGARNRPCPDNRLTASPCYTTTCSTTPVRGIGVELILAGGADAGVGCDAQLPRDNFVVRRDYNDTLLFQRKVSVGLLLCHAVHLPLQQHTLPHQGRNSYNQNGEKSSVKCEICTKLDSDTPCDLFDFILRKPDRPECLQELADA